MIEEARKVAQRLRELHFPAIHEAVPKAADTIDDLVLEVEALRLAHAANTTNMLELLAKYKTQAALIKQLAEYAPDHLVDAAISMVKGT